MKTMSSVLLAILAGASFAYGCGDGDGLIDGVTDIRIGTACADYCGKAKECSDETDRDNCESDCEENMMNCMADEQEEAVEDIEGCAEESCDDFVGCTIGAGLQCSFGI